MDIDFKQLIIKELAIENFPPEARERILVKVGENIMKRVTLVLLENLPEKNRPQLETLSQAGDAIALQNFLKSNIIDADDLVKKTIQEAIREFKELAGIK
ncbi:MAG: hypothetical protein HZC14_03365 [Candidatus Niyogibacteria bacterium]|nr:hypothetical protein [Candidatus Niyogibacteria bacterium]